jgi:hypothetical protein
MILYISSAKAAFSFFGPLTQAMEIPDRASLSCLHPANPYSFIV